MLLALGLSLDVHVFAFVHVDFLLRFFNCVRWVLKDGFLVVITLSINSTEIILSTSRRHAIVSKLSSCLNDQTNYYAP